MIPKHRAVRDDQKQQRRQAMIDIAWQLFADRPYEAITMAEVAERAGLAKGTVYLYFKTKEALFLAAQEQQLAGWFDELDARLGELAGRGDAALVAVLISETLERRVALVRLLAIVHTVLEHNVDFDTALRFKRMLLERFGHTGELLEACLPALARGSGPAILLQLYALIIGVEHSANPAPIVRRVLREPGMRVFDIPFGPTFFEAALALLRGREGGD
jgi:AcrR family transcriptional regulator